MLAVDVVVAAFDTAASITDVLAGLATQHVRHVYVVDRPGGSAARVAGDHGAITLGESRRGYGAACRCGVAHIIGRGSLPDVVVFMHGGGSDDPAEVDALVRPIERQGLDLVIGSRALGEDDAPKGLRDRVGREVAIGLIRAIYGQRYTDLGGFRAIRLPALVSLGMSDDGPGYNVEMQVKAVKSGLRVAEVPVHRRRSAPRPVSTLRERAVASSKVLYTIIRHSTAR
ncbi:MAG: glycosyltransferase family 2 protein [Polyangia bacterium]